MERIKQFTEKTKQLLSKLTLKHYIGIGVGLILLYFIFSWIFSSSSKGIELIPTNTPVVAVISMGDIIDKADIDGLLELDLDIVEDLLDLKEDALDDLEDESELLSSIMEDPEDIGIDIYQDIFIYAVLEDIEKGEAYLCFSGGVDDDDRLLEIIEEIEDQMPNDDYESSYSYNETIFDIEEEDDYTIALRYQKSTYNRERYDDEEDEYYDIVAFAWDDEKFLFITNPDAYGKKDIDKLEDEVERLFTLKSQDKLTSINSFDDFYDDKTDLCLWASAEGLDDDLLKDFVKGLDRETGGEIDLDVEDVQECSASIFYNFGDGDISLKAAFYTSDGVQELLQEKTGLETSELSYEVIMKFDDSGDNTIHVLLRSILTIADELGLDKMMRGGFENDMFDTYSLPKEMKKDDPYYYDDYGSGSGSGTSGSARSSDYYDY
ncbi:DUF4836 family protein [Flavobacteriales bacterium]|nr:DUF4836 family protein [Flavobacteriales bacterium]